MRLAWLACAVLGACSGSIGGQGGPDGAAAVRDAHAGDAPADPAADAPTSVDAGVVDAHAPPAADAPVAPAADAPVAPAADAPTAPAADAPLAPDGPPAPDAPLAPDAGSPPDAPLADARVVDAPLPADAAPSPDASPPPDARPPPDAGPDAMVGPGPTLGGCPMFPPDDPWNTPVTDFKTDDAWTAKLQAHTNKSAVHPDFGPGFGFPINIVPQNEPLVSIDFDNPDESDLGDYPYPGTLRIEGGTPTACDSDCHVLVLQQGACELWEAYACLYTPGSNSWFCGSGAKWDLTKISAGQRPKGWTSADAAGLSITAGAVRYEEAASGHVNHAIRFTMHCTQDGWVYPASHQAVPGACPNITSDELRDQYPPMGTRIRLKDSYDIDGLPTQAHAIAQAMKTYGLILADNGSDWYIGGEDSQSWDNDQLDLLKAIPADQFDVLEMPPIER